MKQGKIAKAFATLSEATENQTRAIKDQTGAIKALTELLSGLLEGACIDHGRRLEKLETAVFGPGKEG